MRGPSGRTRFRARARKVVENRALGPMITVALCERGPSACDACFELLDLLVEVRDVPLCDPAHIAAAAPPVLPEPQQLFDLAHRKPQPAGAPDELERVDVARIVDSVAGIRYAAPA